jgi:hypothetical protein
MNSSAQKWRLVGWKLRRGIAQATGLRRVGRSVRRDARAKKKNAKKKARFGCAPFRRDGVPFEAA